MIVCRRPCTVYDVDVIGVAVLVVLALTACFGVIMPASANATQWRALSARIAAVKAVTEQTNGRLRKVNAEISALQTGVAERTRAAPKPGALTSFLQRVAQLAEECGLQITQVLPQPAQQANGCLASDVWFSGRGTGLSFARLLDELVRENPYHALQDFRISHSGDPDDPRCTVSWTLRLYILEDEALEPAEEAP
jgi:hypothetical protein